MKEILDALKDVILSYYPERSFVESMMKFDFKIGEAKTNMMRLCFSNLASWPLIFILFAIANDPFRQSWSLVRVLTYTHPIILFLLNGLMPTMLIVFFIFYVLQWVFRKEYLFLAIIFYFIAKSELHIHLAVSAVMAVYLSRISYMYWMVTDCESETKKIWKAVSALQLVSWVLTVILVLTALDYLQVNHLFNEKTEMSRFNFLAISVLIYHIVSHLFLSLWGHFYFQKSVEPSQIPTFFSTASWILRFNMSYHLQALLKSKIAEQTESHKKNETEFQNLKSQHQGLANMKVEEVIHKELTHLKEASLRLSKI